MVKMHFSKTKDKHIVYLCIILQYNSFTSNQFTERKSRINCGADFNDERHGGKRHNEPDSRSLMKKL